MTHVLYGLATQCWMMYLCILCNLLAARRYRHPGDGEPAGAGRVGSAFFLCVATQAARVWLARRYFAARAMAPAAVGPL